MTSYYLKMKFRYIIGGQKLSLEIQKLSERVLLLSLKHTGLGNFVLDH